VAKTFEDGRRHQTEEVVTSKHGKQYNVLTWTAPLRNDDDEITQVMEMATNITEVRRLQDHLTSLGLMLGSMSHGVKGMLTALDGGIYQLETGINKKDNDRIERGFHRIQHSSSRIRKMVLEILFYAKSRGMQHEKTDVAKLAEAVVDAVKPMADKNGHTLAVDIASDAGSFEADPNWILQSIVNFLENAVDACSDDAGKNSHRIDFRVYPQGKDKIVFDIADNGIGMDEDTRQKMFTLFFSSKGSKGTGLGLFISNHIIRQHGGQIEVASEYGKGTHVQISMPRFRTAESSIARPLLDNAN
jgi:signal transduction histidine kinase